jgi:hypothetical protein
MPNIWTHLIFGQELLEKLQHEAMLRDTQLKRVFNLGCQGPDFLFYHNFWPWNRDKTMPQLGSGMHAKECGPFLLSLLKHVQGRGLYNPAVIYVLGFMAHLIWIAICIPIFFTNPALRNGITNVLKSLWIH